MPSILPVFLVVLTVVLVFAAGWRMLPAQNSAAGGTGALLLFLLHPAFIPAAQSASPWDALFVMLFVAAWLAMEHWSLFMRSWVLAGIFSFGLWIGSPVVLWGLIAMVPWILFNRRPLAALGSFLIVFLGGLVIFSITWGGIWFFIPNVGRPLVSQWVRWSGFQPPPALSLPWAALVVCAVADRGLEMLQNRRADASMFAAMLLVVMLLLGSAGCGLALIALSSPLIARVLMKKEFLFHRRVRWVAGATIVLTLVLAYVLRREAWRATGMAMLSVALVSWWIYRSPKLPRFMVGEAVCVGAFLAESLGTLLHLFPS